MISFVILMQIIYYSMDRMFFSDTYFTWGFDDKIEKNIEPWWEFHSGPACCSVKLWKLSSKFFVQFSGLVCQYFKILIYAIFWRYVFDYWCFNGIVELVVATCWMDFLVHAMDSDINPRSYEHIWLVKAPWWIQCPGCLGQAVCWISTKSQTCPICKHRFFVLPIDKTSSVTLWLWDLKAIPHWLYLSPD